MDEREEIEKDTRKIQEFRESGKRSTDARKNRPAWDAGIAPRGSRRGSLVAIEMVDKQKGFQ